MTRLGAVDGLVPWMDVRCRMLVMVFFAAYSAGPDMGPTFGADYGGDDYNVTSWNTPKSKAADNYKASALACEAYCDADPKCCAWTCETARSATAPDRLPACMHWLNSTYLDRPVTPQTAHLALVKRRWSPSPSRRLTDGPTRQ